MTYIALLMVKTNTLAQAMEKRLWTIRKGVFAKGGIPSANGCDWGRVNDRE